MAKDANNSTNQGGEGNTESQQSQQQSTEGTDQQKPQDFKPITSQDEFDRAIAPRLARQRKQVEEEVAETKFSDYQDLKAAAEELQQIKDAEKSDTDRLQEKVDRLAKERDRAQEELSALRVAKDRADFAREQDVNEALLHGDNPDEWRNQAQLIKQELTKDRGYAPGSGSGDNRSPVSGGAERAAAYLNNLKSKEH